MPEEAIMYTVRRTALVLAIAIAFLAGMLNAKGDAHTSQPRPPYYHMDPPKWCDEDMICWIGSGADGRSAKAAQKDWMHQMRTAHDDMG